jgi:integrase
MRFDAIDFDKHQWVLNDTKNDERLVLPLPWQAMQIIDGLQPLAEEHGSPFVFFSVRPDARQGHLDPTSGAPASRIRARSEVSDFRPHDIRPTVRTNLAEMGVGKEVAEAILNHVQDKMSETYNRHRYQSQMGEALQRWADRLDQIVRGGKAEVLHMGARRA